MKAVLLVALFGASLINAVFFGCSLAPATGITDSGGWGWVACYSGNDDGVATLACTLSYFNLTSAPNAAHWHVGGSTDTGNPTFFWNTGVTTMSSAVSGTFYQKITATSAAPNNWVQQSTTTFANQITNCAQGNVATGCYFNLHTANHGGGELRCQGATFATPTYSFDLTLVTSPGVTSPTNSTGLSTIKMASVGTKRAWGYQVSFDLGSSITNAHIHQATSFNGNGGVVVQFDWGTARTSGSFVGVALEGIDTVMQPLSNFPTYPADFDSAVTNHFAYVNIHSSGNTGGEIRGNFSPSSTSGASQVTVALFAVFFMVAAWMSL